MEIIQPVAQALTDLAIFIALIFMAMILVVFMAQFVSMLFD